MYDYESDTMIDLQKARKLQYNNVLKYAALASEVKPLMQWKRRYGGISFLYK
jgi:hypothetical protein